MGYASLTRGYEDVVLRTKKHSRLIASIYKENELDKVATVAKNATVQIEKGRSVEMLMGIPPETVLNAIK